ETPAVVLIDEIEKADIEFPNDLLRELDRMEFSVYELHRTIVAKQRPCRSDAPAVVLINEIDKADIEFPNDLLREPDRMEFYVYELHRTIVAKRRPLVVITSNNDKELPDASLPRCFFHYIRFPDKATMTRIVDVHYPGLKKALLSEALEVFFNLREVPGLKKKPSTSELLDWLKLLLAEDIPIEALHSADRKAFIPPLHGALLKNEQDVHLFEKVAFMARAGRGVRHRARRGGDARRRSRPGRPHRR